MGVSSVSSTWMYIHHLGTLLNYRFGFSLYGVGSETLPLYSSSQVMPTLLVHGPHFVYQGWAQRIEIGQRSQISLWVGKVHDNKLGLGWRQSMDSQRRWGVIGSALGASEQAVISGTCDLCPNSPYPLTSSCSKQELHVWIANFWEMPNPDHVRKHLQIQKSESRKYCVFYK